MPSSDSSANRWLRRLESGDDQAAEKLWHAYFEKLVRVAAGRLQARHRQKVDPEDIALSAFDSFCRGVQRNKFPELADRDGLWRLLVSITIHKVLHEVRSQARIKRGGQMTQVTGLNADSDDLMAINQLVSREPSPELAIEIAEHMQTLMSALEDPQLEKIAYAKLEGQTNDEIAVQISTSLRTVERKLNLIRKIWALKGIGEASED